MSSVSIDIDDQLIKRAMRRYGFRTKRETVDSALRQIVRPPLTRAEFLALEGVGWSGDLDEMRTAGGVPRI